MPKLVTVVSYEPEDIDVGEAVAEALQLRPEVRLLDLALENREAGLRIARSNALPSLDLFGSWQDRSNELEERDWTVGLELSVPISSSSLREAVRQARWALLVLEQERENLDQEITAEVRAEARSASAAQANVEIASQAVEVARRSLRSAERLAEEGLRTNRDVLDAQDDLTREERSLVTSKTDYYLSLVRLRRVIGIDISQDLPEARSDEAGEEVEDVSEDVSGDST